MSRRWELRGRSCVLTLAEDPAGLVLLDWSPDGSATPVTEPSRPTPFLPEVDRTRHLLPAAGVRQLRGVDLQVSTTTGTPVRGTGLRLRSVEQDGRRIRAYHVDDTDTVGVTLEVTASADHDVLTSRVTVVNHGPAAVVLDRVHPGSWYVPVADGVTTVDYLSGAWSHEFTPTSATFGPGCFGIGSASGLTSHEFAPWLAVRSGEVTRSVLLQACSSWRLGVEVGHGDPWARVHGGLTDQIRLGPGERHTTPASHGLACHGDPAPHWHDFLRGLGRGLTAHHHPVVHNSWYATEFDVSVDQQVALARRAADLGAEVFVVDDGWFRGRTSDRSGLGDWQSDPVKFPDGLGPLVQAVTGLGMRFGLWVEPEAVNPDSDLYRAHPDWVHRGPHREPLLARHQLVLDFGRAEVVAWAKDWLRELLSSQPISYLKWDMNRAITDTTAAPASWALDHARGYLSVMAMLREEFPDVTVEACSGGGGRIDPTVLGLSDVVWTSDETGPRDRLAIQHGFTRVFPASVMSSWVTDMPDLVDTEPASLQFRCLVAMCGVMGIGTDLSAASPEELATIGSLVRRYRELRPTILGGRLRWHGRPADPACAVEYADATRTVLFAFRRAATGADLTVTTESGREVAVRWELADDCDLVVLDGS